jgi:hypothetical protein
MVGRLVAAKRPARDTTSTLKTYTCRSQFAGFHHHHLPTQGRSKECTQQGTRLKAEQPYSNHTPFGTLQQPQVVALHPQLKPSVACQNTLWRML